MARVHLTFIIEHFLLGCNNISHYYIWSNCIHELYRLIVFISILQSDWTEQIPLEPILIYSSFPKSTFPIYLVTWDKMQSNLLLFWMGVAKVTCFLKTIADYHLQFFIYECLLLSTVYQYTLLMLRMTTNVITLIRDELEKNGLHNPKGL